MNTPNNTNSQVPSPAGGGRRGWGWYLFLLFLIVASVWIIKRHQGEQAQDRHLQPGTEVKANGYLTNEGSVFGTIYHITYQNHRDLKPEIEAVMQAIDLSLSMFNEQSTVARINRNEAMLTDSLFRQVFSLAKEVHQSTGGCFDPTVAPLVNAWGFGYKNGELPDSAQVDSLLQLVGLDRVWLCQEGDEAEDCQEANSKAEDYQVEENLLTISTLHKEDSLTILDFSAIAKGFAVDKVAEMLAAKDVKNYMVEIGGEVIVKGVNPKKQPWSVGIANPVESGDGGLNKVLQLQDKAMATSGNYRNFYVTEDGRKLAHTIDPHSGYPVQHSLLSSTVFAPTCAKADAFATAFMVMGVEQAKEVLKHEPDLEVYFIYTDADGQFQVFSTLPAQ